MCCKKYLKDNKRSSFHLAGKYARIFVLGEEAHSFPRTTLSENCSLLGTDTVRGQISEDIFIWRQMEAIVYLYNNKINAGALIGQLAMVYCTSKPMEKSRVLSIFI